MMTAFVNGGIKICFFSRSPTLILRVEEFRSEGRGEKISLGIGFQDVSTHQNLQNTNPVRDKA